MRLTDYYMLEEDVSRLKKTIEIKEREAEAYKTMVAVFTRNTYELLKLLGLKDEEIMEWYSNKKN